MRIVLNPGHLLQTAAHMRDTAQEVTHVLARARTEGMPAMPPPVGVHVQRELARIAGEGRELTTALMYDARDLERRAKLLGGDRATRFYFPVRVPPRRPRPQRQPIRRPRPRPTSLAGLRRSLSQLARTRNRARLLRSGYTSRNPSRTLALYGRSRGSSPLPLLKNGSRGPAVKDLQQRLRALGFNPGPVDGIFGPKTAAAVKAFQRSRGLAVDGVVGPQTHVALRPAFRPPLAGGTHHPRPWRPPPPRIYIINGIGSKTRGGAADPFSRTLEKFMQKHGYSASDTTSTPAVYNDPFDWRDEVIWGREDRGGRKLRDSYQVQKEYHGKTGRWTEKTYNWIKNDLKNDPLLPGQKIVLIGHSGGGAIAANLAAIIEQRTRADVGGLVTLGSPRVDWDGARKYAETMVAIKDVDDPLGISLHDNRGVHYESVNSRGTGALAAHSSYKNSKQVVEILKQHFPTRWN